MTGGANKSKADRDRFPMFSEPDGGGRLVRLRRATCGKCGYQGSMTDQTVHGLPAWGIAQKFEQRGWRIGT